MNVDYYIKPRNIFNLQIFDKIIRMPSIVTKLISSNQVN